MSERWLHQARQAEAAARRHVDRIEDEQRRALARAIRSHARAHGPHAEAARSATETRAATRRRNSLRDLIDRMRGRFKRGDEPDASGVRVAPDRPNDLMGGAAAPIEEEG